MKTFCVGQKVRILYGDDWLEGSIFDVEAQHVTVKYDSDQSTERIGRNKCKERIRLGRKKNSSIVRRKNDIDGGGSSSSIMGGGEDQERRAEDASAEEESDEEAWEMPKKKRRRKKNSSPEAESSVPLYCLCRRPDDGTGQFFIGCDGKCKGWFHPRCVGLNEEKCKVDPPKDWKCPNCQEHKDRVVAKVNRQKDMYKDDIDSDELMDSSEAEELRAAEYTIVKPALVERVLGHRDRKTAAAYDENLVGRRVRALFTTNDRGEQVSTTPEEYSKRIKAALDAIANRDRARREFEERKRAFREKRETEERERRQKVEAEARARRQREEQEARIHKEAEAERARREEERAQQEEAARREADETRAILAAAGIDPAEIAMNTGGYLARRSVRERKTVARFAPPKLECKRRKKTKVGGMRDESIRKKKKSKTTTVLSEEELAKRRAREVEERREQQWKHEEEALSKDIFVPPEPEPFEATIVEYSPRRAACVDAKNGGSPRCFRAVYDSDGSEEWISLPDPSIRLLPPNTNDDDDRTIYLVKWNDRSFAHCSWVTRDLVVEDSPPHGKAKLNRYLSGLTTTTNSPRQWRNASTSSPRNKIIGANSSSAGETRSSASLETRLAPYVNRIFLQVDRVVDATLKEAEWRAYRAEHRLAERHTAVDDEKHSPSTARSQATLVSKSSTLRFVSTRWISPARRVMSRLINYRSCGIRIAEPFIRPVNESKDYAPGYHSVVIDPISFSEIRERLDATALAHSRESDDDDDDDDVSGDEIDRWNRYVDETSDEAKHEWLSFLRRLSLVAKRARHGQISALSSSSSSISERARTTTNTFASSGLARFAFNAKTSSSTTPTTTVSAARKKTSSDTSMYEGVRKLLDLPLMRDSSSYERGGKTRWMQDVRRVFDNCALYTPDASAPIRLNAAKLEEAFERLLDKEFKTSSGSNRESEASNGGANVASTSEDDGDDEESRPKFLVKWCGVSYAYASWESPETLYGMSARAARMCDTKIDTFYGFSDVEKTAQRDWIGGRVDSVNVSLGQERKWRATRIELLDSTKTLVRDRAACVRYALELTTPSTAGLIFDGDKISRRSRGISELRGLALTRESWITHGGHDDEHDLLSIPLPPRVLWASVTAETNEAVHVRPHDRVVGMDGNVFSEDMRKLYGDRDLQALLEQRCRNDAKPLELLLERSPTPASVSLKTHDDAATSDLLRWCERMEREERSKLRREEEDSVSSKFAYKESPSFCGGRKLRSYQVESLNWLVHNWLTGRNCILADEMGLGKTVQSTAFVRWLAANPNPYRPTSTSSRQYPFLCVVPLSTVAHWRREVESWTNLNCVVYHDPVGGARTRKSIRDLEFYFWNVDGDSRVAVQGRWRFDVLITTYETLIQDIDALAEVRWRLIVIDEAQRLKRAGNKLLRCLRMLDASGDRSRSKQRYLLLSGTPLQNNMTELWTLLNFIEPRIFPDEDEFLDKFGDLRTLAQVEELTRVLRPFLLRRLKEHVEKTIPVKEETVVDIELTTLQKQYYRAIFERNREFLHRGIKSKASLPSLTNLEMQLRKCCNHPFMIEGAEEREVRRDATAEEYVNKLVLASGKMVLLDKLLTKLKREERKVLIFSQMTKMLDIIENYCFVKQWSTERIDGGVRGELRQAAIDRFQSPETKWSVFLLSTRAGGVGINLTAADTVVIFDSDWNPQNDIQAMARCHRIGQTKEVRVFRLVTRRTYESVMLERAAKKLGLEQAVLGDGIGKVELSKKGEGRGQKPNKDEIERLLRHGAYGQFAGDAKESEKRSQAFCDADIDTILQNNSRVHLWEGSKDKASSSSSSSSMPALNFSKATFVGGTGTDASLDVTDENFWTQVLGRDPRETISGRIRDLKGLEKATADASSNSEKEDPDKSHRVALFEELRGYADVVVEAKLDGVPRPSHEQEIVDALVLVTTMPIFGEKIQKNALLLTQEIDRPRRKRKQESRKGVVYYDRSSRNDGDYALDDMLEDDDKYDPDGETKKEKKKKGRKPKKVKQKKERIVKKGGRGGKPRRVRCKNCENCLRKQDCGACTYCLDKPKFGGAGRMKQSCKKRKCTNLQSSLTTGLTAKTTTTTAATKTPASETVKPGVVASTYTVVSSAHTTVDAFVTTRVGEMVPKLKTETSKGTHTSAETPKAPSTSPLATATVAEFARPGKRAHNSAIPAKRNGMSAVFDLNLKGKTPTASTKPTKSVSALKPGIGSVTMSSTPSVSNPDKIGNAGRVDSSPPTLKRKKRKIKLKKRKKTPLRGRPTTTTSTGVSFSHPKKSDADIRKWLGPPPPSAPTKTPGSKGPSLGGP
eukprot:g779.t1